MLSLLLPLAMAGPQTVMVGLEGPSSEARLRADAEVRGATIRCWRSAPICVVELAGRPDLVALRDIPGVRYAEADRPMAPPPPPLGDEEGTEDCPDLWELRQIGLPAAVAATGERGAGAPVVAVQDTGFLVSHVDLLGHTSGAYDYGNGDPIPEVEWDAGVPGHGTFIAGIIAATDDNGLARAGVLPEGRVNLQKIADHDGALYFSYAVAAMLDLADGDLGVRVLNYSIASPSTTQAFDEAVAALGRADILLVAAAGNCGSANCWDADNDAYPLFPANNPGSHVLSVAGSLRDDALNSWSHYGVTTVDLAAPGVDICSLGVSSDTATHSAAGTSYAAPLVAATAALVMGAWPELSAVETARVIKASALDVPALEGLVRTGGRLDAGRAVATAVPRLDAPEDGFFVGDTTLALRLGNAAAAGEATALLLHGDGLSVEGLSGAAGWTATPFSVGETISLPDAGAHVATRAGTLLEGPLAAATQDSLGVVLAGRVLGEHALSVRLIATSAGSDYLNAPYAEGEADETGFLAHAFTMRVDGLAPDDPVDTGSIDSGLLSDTGPADGVADPARDGDDPAAGCGCGGRGAPAGPVGLALAGLGLGLVRRVRGTPMR